MSIVEHSLITVRRRYRWRDRLILMMSAVLVASLWVAVAPPPAAMSAPPAQSAKTKCPAERPDEAAALVTARLCGGRVEVASRRSERLQVWANPSGSLSAESTLEPERMRDAKGAWVQVDMTLVRRPDGSVAPRAHPNGLVLAGSAPDRDNDLASLRVGKETLTLGWRGALPSPVLSGTTATYPEVRPGIDLVVEATRTSYLYSLVVKDRQAAAGLGQIAMPWRTGSLTAVAAAGGGLELRDKAGHNVARVGAPRMWDATVDRVTGDHSHGSGLGMSVVARRGGHDLMLAPPRSFLDDPSTVYPVTIDPGPNDYNPNFDAYIQSDTTGDLSGSTELRIGSSNSGAVVTRTFLSFWLGGFLHGSTIQQSNLFLWNTQSPSCTTALWQLYFSPYVNGTLRWSNQPGLPLANFISGSNQTLGASGCGQNWVWSDAAAGVQRLADDWASSTVNFRVHAASETNNSYWKKFSSAQGAHQPILRIQYTMKPTVAATATTPVTECLTGGGRPFVSTTTPTLRATVNDAEGASVNAEFEWWTTSGSMIGSTVSGNAASGSTVSVMVPSGAFSNGGTYSWRARGNDGLTSGDWSAWCEFTVDTVAPASAPGVSSAAYPAGTWAGDAGTAGTFTFTPSGVSDVAAYRYGLDESPPTTVVSAASLGGNASPSITPATAGPHTLYVQSVDRAGSTSPTTSYVFNVGVGAVLSPRTGDVSAAKFALEALAPSAATGVTYQWRRGDADTWTTIPTADVTVAAGGGAVTWPQAGSGGVFATLNWDVAKTLNDAESGVEPRDGPLQVHAVFTGPSTTSDAVKATFDLNRGSAAAVGVGPGDVNLLTGNLTVGQSDVSAFGMGLSRAYSTRLATGVDAMFGPGWVSSTVAEANPGYTNLTVTGSLVQIGLPDATTLGFALDAGTAASATYEPQVGAEAFTLAWTSSPDRFILTDGTGNIVRFTRPSGGAAGVYVPSSVTPVGSADSATVSWELVPGSTTQARPTRVLGSVPAGVSCSTLVAGCKALTFSYATSTTATGTAEAQWGDYTDRVTKVEFTAYDPDLTPTPGMRTIEVARYAYDSTGRLRAAWDPRLDWTDTGVTPPVTRHVQTTYAYDGNGILATLTPPGQESWQFAYTTVPGDSGLGRLSTVTRSALTAGAAVSTVVYRVPVSGGGAPYDLSVGQTARWAQAEAPTDAAAVFPATQVPTVNQPAGTLPSSYEYATVSYLDANGRAVNTAAPGGGVTSTWYDTYGNVTRTLTAGNRQRALNASGADTSAAEAVLAANLSTIDTYSADGKQLLSTVGPEHDIALSAGGGVVRGRERTVSTYDQGAPGTGGPYNLVTTVSASVRYTGPAGTPVDADTRTTTTDYDWDLRSPTVETVDPAGLVLTTRTTYDSDGRVVSQTAPAGGVTTNTPSTLQTVYYTVAANGTYPSCGGQAYVAGLPCRLFPGGQPATGPQLPAKTVSYNMYGQLSQVTETTGATTLRTTTITVDSAGRTRDLTISATGLGTAVAKTRTVYDPATGRAARTQSLDATNAVTAEIVRSYDSLGRLVSYVDADGNTTTTTYDIASRVSAEYDGKATRSYTYDGGSERRGLPTQVVDTGAGTMTASYDPDGVPTSQTWPGNLAVTSSVNEAGTPTAVSYVQTGCGQPDCTVFAETATVDAHGELLGRTSTLSSQAYGYDAAGRLTTVKDTVANQCTTRAYAFDGTAGQASNRTGLTTYAPSPNGTCQTTEVATTRAYTYDAADRITTTGTVYDNLGRTLTTPAADGMLPASGDVTTTYHVNDMVRTITQGSRTATYTLDVIGNRFRSYVDNGSGSAVTRTHHYTGDGDSPAWTDEGGGTWSRPVAGFASVAAIQLGPTAGNIVWQITNLHGDLVAGVVAGTPGLSYTGEQTEYGQPRNPADIGTRRYGWLGGSQRAADTPGGSLLMGARLYHPGTGRFGSVDPVHGGSANAYEYCGGAPIDCTDLTGMRGVHSNCWDGRRWRYRCQVIVSLGRFESFVVKFAAFGFLFTLTYGLFVAAIAATAGLATFAYFTLSLFVGYAAEKLLDLVFSWGTCVWIKAGLKMNDRPKNWPRYGIESMRVGLYQC